MRLGMMLATLFTVVFGVSAWAGMEEGEAA
jgi:hypothetical protein